jgi:hypothetical protein
MLIKEAGSIKMPKFPKEHKLHMWHKLHKLHKLFIFQRYTIRMSSSSVVLTSFITWSWQAWSTLKRMRTPATQPLTIRWGATRAQEVRGPTPYMLLWHRTPRLRATGRLHVLWRARHAMGMQVEVSHRPPAFFVLLGVIHIKNAIYVFYALYACNTLYSDFMQVLCKFNEV